MPESITPGNGIQVGDAVVEFLANTQNFDSGVDKIEARMTGFASNVERSTGGISEGFGEAGDAADEAADEIESAGERSTKSLHEARGEAMLLGEAFGVHLPRHVSTFIAELPGVGEALSAAFSATAILFVIEAVVKLTEKVTDFVSTTFIYTQAMKDADKATADLNKTILANEAEIAKLDAAYDALTMTPVQLLTKQLDEVNQKIADQQKAFAAAKDTVFAYEHGMDGVTEAQKNAAEAIIAANKTTTDMLVDENRNISTQIQKIYDQDAEKARAGLIRKAQEYRDFLDALAEKTIEEMNKLDAAQKTIARFDQEPEMTPFVKSLLAATDAAHKFGIVLKSDLESELKNMENALVLMANSGLVADKDLNTFAKQIEDLQKKIDNFDKDATPKMGKFFRLIHSDALDAEKVMYGFGDAYGGAIAKAISGEESLGKAMQQGTADFIKQIGMRALYQGMFYIANGIADIFWHPDRAAADFAAGGELLALGAAAAGAGAAIGGVGGSGSAGGSSWNGGVGHTSPVQTTGSAAPNQPAVITQAQHFASGGLISSPTLSVIGDSPSGPEAVLPLGDEGAMSQIAEAVVSRMSGSAVAGHSSTHHNSFFGKLSKSDLRRLTRQLNQAVMKGHTQLQATSVGRATGRHPSATYKTQ